MDASRNTTSDDQPLDIIRTFWRGKNHRLDMRTKRRRGNNVWDEILAIELSSDDELPTIPRPKPRRKRRARKKNANKAPDSQTQDLKDETKDKIPVHDDYDENECMICFDREVKVITSCFHKYCSECLVKQKLEEGKTNLTCAKCRADICNIFSLSETPIAGLENAIAIKKDDLFAEFGVIQCSVCRNPAPQYETPCSHYLCSICLKNHLLFSCSKSLKCIVCRNEMDYIYKNHEILVGENKQDVSVLDVLNLKELSRLFSVILPHD